VGDESVTAGLPELAARLDDKTACLIVQSPNFLGQIEDLDGLAERRAPAGAMLVVVVTESDSALACCAHRATMAPTSWLAKARRWATASTMAGHTWAFSPAGRRTCARMAGRLVGQTVDAAGRQARLCANARHPRAAHPREKASSNICTNQALCALAASIHLAALGKSGLRRLAELCYHKAHYAPN